MNTGSDINKLARISIRNKNILIASSAFSIVIFHIGIFFIDNRWWWSLFFIVPLCIATFHMLKENIFKSPLLKSEISFAFGWISFYTFIFVFICALFITPLWWIGLVLVLIIVAALGSLTMEPNEDMLPLVVKKQIAIATLSWFLMIFLLFCLPSFSANSSRNPQEGFAAQWSPVESYSIYGMGIRDTEHIIAQSWYNSTENYVNDYINTVWSNMVANNARGNLPFGNVKKSRENTIYDNNNIVGYKDDEYFMPTDEYKGDVARIMLYMYITYQDDSLKKDYINVGLMKKWSKQDPVDDREKERNKTIDSQYKYSNKLVDRPWLVRFIV